MIELLIVISIMTILTGALIPSFTSYMKDQNIKQAIEQVKSDLRTIQNNALTDSLPAGVTLSLPLYWGISFVNNSSDYYYFVTDSTGVTCSTLHDNTKKFTLPNGVTPLDDYCTFFDFVDGSVSGDTYIAVEDTRSILCVKINDAGLISTGVWNEETLSCD